MKLNLAPFPSLGASKLPPGLVQYLSGNFRRIERMMNILLPLNLDSFLETLQEFQNDLDQKGEDITSLQGDVGSLQEDVTSLQGSIGTLQEEVLELQSFPLVVSGIEAVTESLIVDTGLTEVYTVVASLSGAPTSGACFVIAELGSTPGEIELSVFDDTYVESLIEISVNWIATGKIEQEEEE